MGDLQKRRSLTPTFEDGQSILASERKWDGHSWASAIVYGEMVADGTIAYTGVQLMTGLVIFGSIVVVGLVAIVAVVFGRGFKGKVDATGGSMEVDGRYRQRHRDA